MPGDKSWMDEADDEYPDEFDDDDSADTVACPHCGAEIYEDAVRCPVCEDYVTHDAHGFSGRPFWWLLLGLAGVVATILALTGYLGW